MQYFIISSSGKGFISWKFTTTTIILRSDYNSWNLCREKLISMEDLFDWYARLLSNSSAADTKTCWSRSIYEGERGYSTVTDFAILLDYRSVFRIPQMPKTCRFRNSTLILVADSTILIYFCPNSASTSPVSRT